MTEKVQTGSCLCGGVRYEIRGPLRDVWGCHCTQCKKTSGNYVAASKAADSDIVVLSDETLAWYRSSETARRGFCNRCGGNLFWKAEGSDRTAIFAGTLDQPTGLKTVKHIFVADKADFTEIAPGVECVAQW